jgi:lysophospholipase L1-like esterase
MTRDRPGSFTRRRALFSVAALTGCISANLLSASAGASDSMNHLVLLGDSTFDNRAYVSQGSDVAALVRQALPNNWTISLLAQDGAMIADIVKQLASLPADATHLLVSVGGNDGLRDAAVLGQSVSTVAEALAELDKVRARFEDEYRRMLDAVIVYKLPVGICTIYAPPFQERALQLATRTALPLLNDVITREAFARALDVVDLRLLFDDPNDFTDIIEPSAQGGTKMARAIAEMLNRRRDQTNRSEIFVR